MNESKEADVMILPKDIDMFKYMLENAEIPHDEISPDSKIILENGVTLLFTEDGMLLSIGEE